MTRYSLPSLQQRRISTASAFIREPITANTDDRNWSWKYLRERFRIKELESLFEQYLLRINHAMLIVYLILQICISTAFCIIICISKPTSSEIIPEIIGHTAAILISVGLLLCVYSEHTFRKFPKLHIILSGFIIVTTISTDVALTIYFTQSDVGDVLNGHTFVMFGNPIYVLLMVYMFLPIQRKWQTISLSILVSMGYIALGYYSFFLDPQQTNYPHLVAKIIGLIVILFCVNLVGVYWRFMSEVAFRRSFLDKRGNLESKFKLDAEKKREEKLLLSVLPKTIMQQVKSDFRKMIENQLYNTNPVSKNNPFPNLYVNRYDMVSILYADICNFTPLTTKLPVDQLVEMLNDLFGKFDESAETNSCLRIKLLGDCYYCVSGVPEYTDQHAHNCVKVGLEMIDIIADVRQDRSVNVDMRIGIHSGSVLSGLIGVRKWQFDVWSNDVTIANHMEQTGKAGRVHVTHKTRELLDGLGYEFVPSDGRSKDPLLQEEGIDTFLIVPKNRPQSNRRQSKNYPAPSIKPRVSIPVSPVEINTLYEGDVAVQVNRVSLPSESSRRPSILNKRRLTHTENTLALKRKTVVTDSALTSFQKIMVNSKEFMEKEIRSMPLSKYHQWFRPEGINPLLLTFTKENWECLLLRQADPLFKLYVLCAIIIFICVFVTQQALMLNANTWGWISGVACCLLLLVVGPVCWVATIHQHVTDPHNDREYDVEDVNPVVSFFNEASKHVIASFNVRATLFIVIYAALYTCAVINLVDCKDLLNSSMTKNPSTSYLPSEEYRNLFQENQTVPPSIQELPPLCCSPWYFTYSCSLIMLMAWTFFRIHYLLKLTVYTAGVSIYGYLIFGYAKEFYTHETLDNVCPDVMVGSQSLSAGMSHLMFLIMIILILHIMDRQMEYIMRLDFQWKQNLEREQKEAQTTHFANKLLLQNILPLHVADMYLNRQQIEGELYHESYQHVGVIFASLPNYSEFYKENEMNEEGKMCLRVLNEIISDFDMLTYNHQFATMEKIKVVGSTYMAACGLQPGRRYSDDSDFEERDKKDNVSTITRFAAAMFEKLQCINSEDLQDFKLRVGIDVGPVIAGVVGAQKPMYDIWGNTVNVASRMDYTGEEGKMHVTSEVGEILQELGWNVECRGEIYVKGKGPMTTYFVDPASAPSNTPSPALVGNNNNHNQGKIRFDSECSERRRSSQLSLSSLKTLLYPHRGSLDFTKGREGNHSTNSGTILKLLKKRRDSASYSDPGDSASGASGSSPRSSMDSKSTTEGQSLAIFQLPSPVEEEIGDVLGSEDTITPVNDKDLQNGTLDSQHPSVSDGTINHNDLLVDISRDSPTHPLMSIETRSLTSENIVNDSNGISKAGTSVTKLILDSNLRTCSDGCSDVVSIRSNGQHEHASVDLDMEESLNIVTS